MPKIVVLGATGFAGHHIVSELAARNHEVVAVARDTSGVLNDPHVTAVTGSVLEEPTLRSITEGTDVIVAALPAFTDSGRLVDFIKALAPIAQRAGARLGVVGGAGNLQVGEGGPLLAETDQFPEDFQPIAAAHAEALKWLRESEESLDWFYFSPAASFGSYNPGRRTGTYRRGDTILVTDSAGNSDISGADYAIAFVDEIEHPSIRRGQFTAAY